MTLGPQNQGSRRPGPHWRRGVLLEIRQDRADRRIRAWGRAHLVPDGLVGTERGRRLIRTELEGLRATRPAVGTLLSEVMSESEAFLWDYRIPLGALTIIDGDPGIGKSMLTIDLAARVSTGRAWPDGSPCALGGVVICSAEDSLSKTIKPRLEAAEGNPERCLYVDLVGDDEHPLTVPDDLESIERAVRRVNASLVIVDPLFSYLSGQVNSYNDQQVRRALRPLAKLAERLGIAVVVVRHLTKDPSKPAMYRGGGSIAITGAARAAFVVGWDPDDPDNQSGTPNGRRVIASVKANLSELAPALAYRTEKNGSGAVRVVWEAGTSKLTASQLLAAPAGEEERSAQEEAADLLYSLLGTGRVESTVVIRQAKAAGISEITLRRAKKRVGVKVEREGFGRDGKFWWRLIDDQEPP